MGFVGYNLAQAKYFDTMNFNICTLVKVKKSEGIPVDSLGVASAADGDDVQV